MHKWLFGLLGLGPGIGFDFGNLATWPNRQPKIELFDRCNVAQTWLVNTLQAFDPDLKNLCVDLI